MFFDKTKNILEFAKAFLISPRNLGALIPSSRFLCIKMVSTIQFDNINRVAELGAGNGVLTHHLLEHLAPDAKLDVYEIQTGFVKELEKIQDRRLIVINKSAESLSERYNVIFSGLPLLSLPGQVSDTILQKVIASLGPEGVFIQFQYSPLLENKLKKYFVWERYFVFFNFPPAFVYICKPYMKS